MENDAGLVLAGGKLWCPLSMNNKLYTEDEVGQEEADRYAGVIVVLIFGLLFLGWLKC